MCEAGRFRAARAKDAVDSSLLLGSSLIYRKENIKNKQRGFPCLHRMSNASWVQQREQNQTNENLKRAS